MSEPQRLERITLDSRAISFNRLRSTSAIYYHWHQCVEFLYISSGYGIVVVDNQHYTARPGRLFIFPPFRLHKVQVDHSEKNPYHRTTMHIEQSVVESIMGGFSRHQAQFAALAASNAPAQIYDHLEMRSRSESESEQGVESEGVDAKPSDLPLVRLKVR